MSKAKTAAAQRDRRHLRVRKKVSGTQARPRLVVFRSLKHIYAQLVDDAKNHTIATVGDLDIDSHHTAEDVAITDPKEFGLLGRVWFGNARGLKEADKTEMNADVNMQLQRGLEVLRRAALT